MRGATYSFGSICVGSLFQGVVACFRCVISSARRNRDNMNGSNDADCCRGLCFCVMDCVANLGTNLLDYFTQWNFIYVALYGLSYTESGKAVMQLFDFKGWHLSTRGSESIISERLTSFVLSCLSCMVGIATGGLVLLVERIVTWQHSNTEDEFDSYVYGPLPHPGAVALV